MLQSCWFQCLLSLVLVTVVMMLCPQTTVYQTPTLTDCLTCRSLQTGAMQNKMCRDGDNHFVFQGRVKSFLKLHPKTQVEEGNLLFRAKVLQIFKNSVDMPLECKKHVEIEVPDENFCKISIMDKQMYIFSGITRTSADGTRLFQYTDVCLNMNYNIQPEQPFQDVIKNNFLTNYLYNCDCTVEVEDNFGIMPNKTDDNCIERVDCIECTNFVSYCTRVNNVCQWKTPDNNVTLPLHCRQRLGWAQITLPSECEVNKL